MISANKFLLVAIVASVLATNQVECSKGTRRHFYARLSNDLKALAKKDVDTVIQLETLKKNGKHGAWSSSFLKFVDKYLKNFANGRNTTDALNVAHYLDEVGTNPLAIFRLLQRASYFLAYRRKESTDISSLPLDDLKQETETAAYPLQSDLKEAAQAILRIHFMYSLSASDLAAGKVRGIQTRTTLLAAHCFYIGLVAKARKEFTLALDWLQEARRLTRIDGSISIATVQAELVELIKDHDVPWEHQDFTDPYFFMKQLKSLRSLSNQKRISTVKDVMYRKFAGKGTNCSYWSANQWGLCLGENFRTPQAASHLFCWHEFKVNKVFTIGPLRMEFLSRNPDIVQIQNSFTESEMYEAASFHRGASSPFVGLRPDVEGSVKIKVAALTGLHSETSSTETDVVNHIPGGHTDIHVDTSENNAGNTNGDRFATLMVYLNNVQYGGYTVFPATFATAIPKKGSAIFWFNALSDGTPDLSTAHAECPVVLGEKWAFYKWVSFYDQLSTRKCLLKPKERFQVLVNGKPFPVPAAFHHKLIEEQEYDNVNPLSVIADAPPKQPVIPRRKYAYNPSTSLKSLVRLDWRIFQNVRKILASTENMTPELPLDQVDSLQENENIQRYLQDFNVPAYNSVLQSDANDMEAITKLAWNPLANYRALWRFENYVKKWMTQEPHERPGGILQRIRKYVTTVYNVSDGPDGMDLENAITGILNTQFVHDLESADISRGTVAGMDTGIVLSAKQCLEIGQEAVSKGYYYQAINWIETAMNKVISEHDTTADLQVTHIELATAKKVHDNILVKSKETAPKFYTETVWAGQNSSNHKETRKEYLYKKYKLRNERDYADINMVGICQGKSHQTTQEKSKLFCWYERRTHPYFRIGPLKVEMLSTQPKPDVVLYHDLLGEKMLAHFRNNDSVRDYKVSTATAWASVDPSIRISATSHIFRDSSPEATHLFQFVNLITGLDSTDNPLRLYSYTPGGHFLAHSDSDTGNTDEQTALVATFMFYVTEAKSGGGTAFVQAGVHSTPKAGSALLWYNTLGSGDMDKEMFHGGCPVIFGEKRVMTLFHYFKFQHHLKCHRDPMRRIEILINGKSKFDPPLQ